MVLLGLLEDVVAGEAEGLHGVGSGAVVGVGEFPVDGLPELGFGGFAGLVEFFENPVPLGLASASSF
ncbi:hypothetical protein ABZ532_31060 [Streptomyces sp. NPDC019396]|uniref:hypothetical protein n=1 Tax=Streptomyces sp. NPDC019396 TaxID=3154687 RepID=UPI0033EDFECE